MNRKLYVGNLPFETSEADLHSLFSTTGVVSSVTLIRDRETGRARGFAFVEMATDSDALNAINSLHQSSFGGRNLAVNEARPQAAPGGGFGRRAERRW